MAVAWVNFRLDLAGPTGFTSDAADSVVNLAGAAYPVSGQDIGGLYPQGWITTNANAAQRTSFATFPHQAGRCGSTSANDANTFHIGGLTIGHDYNIYASLGTIDSNVTLGFTIYSAANRTGALYTVAGVAVNSGIFMDATGATWTGATGWNASQAPHLLSSVTTTDIYFNKSSTNSAYFNTIGIEDVTAGPAASGSPTFMMMGV